MSAPQDRTVAPETAAASRAGLTRRVLRNPLGLAAVVVIGAIVVIGLISPWITPHDPNATELPLTNADPGGEYLLGGDGSGRDIFSRLIAATAVTVEAALIATGASMLLGVVFGLLAGYYGRATDAVATWVSNVLMALPAIVVLIALYAAIGASTRVSMLVFGVLLTPSFFRLVRNLVIGVRNELYIDAARVSGLPDRRILIRHVLYAVRAPVIIQAAFVAGVAIAIQAGLEFLGLGDPGQPSWGGMLEEAFANLYIAPLQLVWPGFMLGITVSALVLFGNALRDALEGPPVRPRRRSAKAVQAAGNAAAPSDRDDAEERHAAMLSVRDLSIAYPTGKSGQRTVVDGVDFDLRPGEILGLVGESGSGKTQTAFSVLGLLPAEAQVTSGSVLLDGRELIGLPERDLAKIRGRSVAYVPQEPMSNLDPAFRVGNQLVYGLRAATGVSKAEAKRVALDLLHQVGINDPRATYRAYPHQISGGMAQRVLIAGAIAAEPDLLIADEPTTALDVTVQAEILDLLRGLQRERGLSVLLVTHNFGVVADLCDRVAVMQHGRIVEQATTTEVFARPQHTYTRTLLTSILDEAPTGTDSARGEGRNHE